ncbi:MAG: type IV toxin-antitoxin system AbiEi family antitoxin domain-containing protein [Solirubrobacteraceae bacterium]
MDASADKRIAALAKRQGGHVTRAQLLALGLGAEAIRHRSTTGRLIRVYNGVYAVGRLSTTRRDQAAGALLACGPHAVLSHRSATALWTITKQWPLPLELTLTRGNSRPTGLRVHRSTNLDRAQITHNHGLRVTTPARTVLDIAPRTTQRRLMRMINDLRLGRLLTIDELNALIARHPRHTGAALIKSLISDDLGVTRSDFEDDFPSFVERYNLPRPILNTSIGGHEVDVYFPVERLIVELDGYDVHKVPRQFEANRARDAEILAAFDIPTVRLTYKRFHDLPDTVAANLHKILETRRRHAQSRAESSR